MGFPVSDGGLLDLLSRRSAETRSEAGRATIAAPRGGACAETVSEAVQSCVLLVLCCDWSGLSLRLVAGVAGSGSGGSRRCGAGRDCDGILVRLLGHENQQFRRQHDSGGGGAEGD